MLASAAKHRYLTPCSAIQKGTSISPTAIARDAIDLLLPRSHITDIRVSVDNALILLQKNAK